MASLDDKSLFEDIFRLENDTPAEAIGPEGDISFANLQAQQLANRTRWLRTQLVSISDFREYTFSKPLKILMEPLPDVPILQIINYSGSHKVPVMRSLLNIIYIKMALQFQIPL